MDFADDVQHNLPAAGDEVRQDRTVGCVGLVVTGDPGSGLVLRVGREGRQRGEFINPQGICYSAADGGLILVADGNCACVQVCSCCRLYVSSK